MGGPSIQRLESIGNSTAGVIVSVELDVAVYATPELTHQLVDLARRCYPHRVCNPYPVHAYRIHGLIEAEEVTWIAPKRVLRTEAHLNTLISHIGDDLQSHVGNLVNVLAVAELAEHGRCADHHIHAIHTGIDRTLCVLDPAADMGQDLGPQAQAGDGLGISIALWGRQR